MGDKPCSFSTKKFPSNISSAKVVQEKPFFENVVKFCSKKLMFVSKTKESRKKYLITGFGLTGYDS